MPSFGGKIKVVEGACIGLAGINYVDQKARVAWVSVGSHLSTKHCLPNRFGGLSRHLIR